MVRTKFYVQFQFLLIPLLFLFNLNHGSSSVLYGPSLELLTSSLHIEDPAGQSSRRTINLSDYAPMYSVVVPLAVNKSTAEPHIVRPVGEFSVEAPQQMRIMAIIQSLHLRTKSVTSAFPPVCRDFIRFGDESINKICGDVQKNDRKGSPPGIIGVRTFLSTTNYLNVTVYTDVSTFVETWMKKPNVVEISFTAYQSCPFYDPDEYMLNCLDNIIPYGPSCIAANLSCDGVINCGFLKEGTFSKDEGNCPLSFSPDHTVDGSTPSTATTTVPTNTTTSTTTTTPPAKTGFPSWWDWEVKQGRTNNVFDTKISNVPSIYVNDEKIDINPTFNSNSQTTKSASTFNPFNYVGIFIVVIGISVFIKILKCLCQEYSTTTTTTSSTTSLDSRSESNLIHGSSSIHTTRAVEESPAYHTCRRSSIGRLQGGVIATNHTVTPVMIPVPIDDHDSPPPPYHSLFPNS